MKLVEEEKTEELMALIHPRATSSYLRDLREGKLAEAKLNRLQEAFNGCTAAEALKSGRDRTVPIERGSQQGGQGGQPGQSGGRERRGSDNAVGQIILKQQDGEWKVYRYRHDDL